SKKLGMEEEPTRLNRMFWTLSLAIVGVGLLSVGGLKAAQTSTLVVALPMLPVMVIMVASLFKMVKEDFPEELGANAITIKPPTAMVSKEV
ncbi:BCCT family transporter, partial [Vibrio natriegens]